MSRQQRSAEDREPRSICDRDAADGTCWLGGWSPALAVSMGSIGHAERQERGDMLRLLGPRAFGQGRHRLARAAHCPGSSPGGLVPGRRQGSGPVMSSSAHGRPSGESAICWIREPDRTAVDLEHSDDAHLAIIAASASNSSKRVGAGCGDVLLMRLSGSCRQLIDVACLGHARVVLGRLAGASCG
jgi:hypothetical protein